MGSPEKEISGPWTNFWIGIVVLLALCAGAFLVLRFFLR